MKRLFKFRYPKIVLLIIAIILAYYIFSETSFPALLQGLNVSKYLIIFIGGLLFSFGFTTPFAIGIFLTTNPENIFLASIIGGLGALASDMVIFNIIKLSFMDEFNRLEHTKPIKKMSSLIKTKINEKIRVYLLYTCAGLIIASPLPDELGITMLAGLTAIKLSTLAKISFTMNALGILIMLAISRIL